MVSAVLSPSGSAPHPLGDDLPRFVRDLRKRLLGGPFRRARAWDRGGCLAAI